MVRNAKFWAGIWVLCAVLASGGPSGVRASDPEAAPVSVPNAEGTEDKQSPGPTVVVVPIIVLPVSDASGRLIKYGYLLIHLEIPKPADRWYVESRIPYIKDAFIREIHRAPDVKPGTEDLDVDALRQRLADQVHALVGNRVGMILFKDIAFPPA